MATSYHGNVTQLTQGAPDTTSTPVIHTIGLADLQEALRLGWEDFKAVPSHAIMLCVIYPVLGLALARAVLGYSVLPLLFPLAGLPLFARGEQLLWGGSALFLLALPLSNVGGLTDWYVAPLIPLLWFGVAVALARLSFSRALLGASLLLASTSICFYLWSPFPGGNAFIPAEYVFTEHHRIGQALLADIPPDAAVVTQSGLGAHLAARAKIALYPWNQPQREPQLWIFDTQNQDIYPLTGEEFWSIINRLRHDPAVSTLHEQDGYFVFRVEGVKTK